MARHLDLEEQEQLDDLKHFWKQYGNLISWFLIAVFGSFAAWNGWQYWQRQQAVQASALYDEVERAAAGGVTPELFVADMTRFRLPKPVDAAICMQDSQGHLLTNEALLDHLRCVARALGKGGLYVFDRYMCSSWTDPARRWSWTRRRGNATVRATFEALKDLNPVTQTFFEDMELEVHENGTRHVYRQRHASRMVFPQELKALVQLAGGFDLVEWFYGFKPHLRLDEAHHPLLMVVVLRKR